MPCAPYELAKTVFFVFVKILDHKDRKSRTRVGHANFSLDSDDFIFLNYCYWVRNHTQVHFFPWLSLLNQRGAFKVFQKCPRRLFIWSPGQIFKAKKWLKISWHCPFYVPNTLKKVWPSCIRFHGKTGLVKMKIGHVILQHVTSVTFPYEIIVLLLKLQ